MNAPHHQPTQSEQILAALERGESLTSLDALNRFGCLRLSGRIYELREAGHPVLDERFTTAAGKNVKRYYLDADYLAAKRAHAAIVDESQELPLAR